MNLPELEKLSDFYIVDLRDIINDIDSATNNSIIKIDHKSLSQVDFDTISQFGRVVKNYLKMMELRPVDEKRNNKLNQLGI